MKTLPEIQQAILELPVSDYAQPSRWLHERDWEQWDPQVEQDSNDDELDFLLAQSVLTKADGTLREL